MQKIAQFLSYNVKFFQPPHPPISAPGATHTLYNTAAHVPSQFLNKIIPPLTPSVIDMFQELHLRALRKQYNCNWINPNKSDADCVAQLFREHGIGLHTYLKQIKRLGNSLQGKPPLLVVILPYQQMKICLTQSRI